MLTQILITSSVMAKVILDIIVLNHYFQSKLYTMTVSQ